MTDMVRTRHGIKPKPAPGDYDPKYVMNLGGIEEHGARCVFKSKTKRTIINKSISNPPPGIMSYNKYKVLMKLKRLLILQVKKFLRELKLHSNQLSENSLVKCNYIQF
jgi:hypothetical protein